MNPIRFTPAVKFFTISLLVAFVLQKSLEMFAGYPITLWLGCSLESTILSGKIYQLLTYSFLHADVAHVVLNLLMLVFIGWELEMGWGTKKFVRYYLTSVLTGSILYLAMQAVFPQIAPPGLPVIGASGGIYGLLIAYGIIFGERTLLFMMLFPMKAKHFIWVLIGVEFMSSIFSGHNALGSVAHLGGMAGGFGYLWLGAYIRVRARFKTEDKKEKDRKERLKKSHLKVVGGTQSQDPDDPQTWH